MDTFNTINSIRIWTWGILHYKACYTPKPSQAVRILPTHTEADSDAVGFLTLYSTYT